MMKIRNKGYLFVLKSSNLPLDVTWHVQSVISVDRNMIQMEI